MAQKQEDQERQIMERLAATLALPGTPKIDIVSQIREAIIKARDANNQVNLNNLQQHIINYVNANNINDQDCAKLIGELYKDLKIMPITSALNLLTAIEQNKYSTSKAKLLSLVPTLKPGNDGGSRNKPAQK